MNKLFKHTYLTIFITAVLAISINAQTEAKQSSLPDLVSVLT